MHIKQARHNLIDHLMVNKRMTLEQAAMQAMHLTMPTMAFMERIKVVCNGKQYIVFRGGPDNNPWFNFS